MHKEHLQSSTIFVHFLLLISLEKNKPGNCNTWLILADKS